MKAIKVEIIAGGIAIFAEIAVCLQIASNLI